MSCGNAIYLNECIRIMNKCNTFEEAGAELAGPGCTLRMPTMGFGLMELGVLVGFMSES